MYGFKKIVYSQFMRSDEIQALKSILSTPKSIVIVPHKNPDGDAIGSCLGLCTYLNNQGHKGTVIAPNDYPDFLKWVPGTEALMIYELNRESGDALIEQADIIFTLDFNALNRSGDMEVPLRNAKAIKVLIDHHQQPEDYARFVYSDVSICATSQMVYHFIEKLNDTNAITPEIATCLYLGIMTDTGNFRFPSTTSTTHRVVAKLIDFGANNAMIYDAVYDTNSMNRLRLLGTALKNLKVIPEWHSAYITLTQDELNACDFKKGDTEGVVNYALSVKDMRFAAIFIENKQDNIVKISLRSKGAFDVNKVARAHFDGGGHVNAAGGRSTASLEETVTYFESILPQFPDLK